MCCRPGLTATVPWLLFLFSMLVLGFDSPALAIRPPRYIVSAQEPQATFTGSQQRAGVYALHFVVNGIFGFGRPRAPSRAQPSKKQKKRRSKEASSGGCGLRFGGGGDKEDELPEGYTLDWDAYRAKFGDTPIEDAVTLMFSEYAALYARIAGWTTSETPTPMTLAEGTSISEQATNLCSTSCPLF